MDKIGIQTCKGYVKEVGDDDNGFVIGIASTSSLDRDGDIIEASGWDTKEFERNPIWLYAHDTHQPPIGRVTELKTEGEALIFKGEFGAHTFGQDMRLLHQSGILKTFSVRFDPVRWEYLERGGSDWPGIHYIEQKLVEISTVPIPANIEAELQSVKQMRYNQLEKNALRRLEAIKALYGDFIGRAVEALLHSRD